MMALTGAEYQDLTSALAAAFPSNADLEMMVRFKLDLNLNTIAGNALPLNVVIYQLVQAMAAFAPPASGEFDLPVDYRAELEPVIAANWQAA